MANYALVLTAPCALQIADAVGNVQTVTQPAGYVYNIVQWDGVSSFAPVDPTGNPLQKILQVNGEPALGTGGVAVALSAAEMAQLAAAQASAQYNALISGGITISSTGTPAISGTYGVSPTDQANFTSAETAVQAGVATFPMTWLLQNGSPVSIPSAAAFLEIAGSAYKFVNQAKLAEATAASGATASWPSQSVTVP